MNITIRRALCLAALAGTAIALPTAALASSAAPAGTAGHQVARAGHGDAVSPCRGGSSERPTEVWSPGLGDGYAGGVTYQIEFSNTGHAACTLRGSPRVVPVSDGHQIGEPGGGTPGGPLVTLAPGATAHVVLNVMIPMCAHPVNGGVMVFPPGQKLGQEAFVQIPGSFCAGEKQLGVDAVHPGAGVPFYTTR
jgi:hypothetical protein